MSKFSGKVFKTGINPCLNVPVKVLGALYRPTGRSSGPIPVRGTLNGKRFRQTVVRYRGAWRLYINIAMRRKAGIDVGDRAVVRIQFDPKPRITPMNARLQTALAGNRKASDAFNGLPPSRKKEISRYLNSLKSAEAVLRNVRKVIRGLTGAKSRPALMR